jgi:hypothetical protein
MSFGVFNVVERERVKRRIPSNLKKALVTSLHGLS